MSELRLRVNLPQQTGGTREFTVIANIYPVSPKTGEPVTSQEARRGIQIPAGPGWGTSQPYSGIYLDPGRYLVEAILPSGETLRQAVAVGPADPPREIALQGDYSPHEWLGWQQFAGSVSGATGYNRRREQDKALISGSLKMELITATSPNLPAAGEPAISEPGGLVARGYFFALPGAGSLHASTPLAAAFPLEAAQPPAQASGPLASEAGDEIAQWQIFDAARVGSRFGKGAEYQAQDAVYEGSRIDRHYLFVTSQGFPAQYCVLPVPWRRDADPPEVGVEVLVRQTITDPARSPGFDQGYRLSLVVRDEYVGSVLAYLGSGKLEYAAAVLEPARDYLWAKRWNPLAAAAGSYVLLAAWTPGQSTYWHGWVENLMNWFPWLPDGAIQRGWVILKTDPSIEGLARARATLLDGFRRGLPFYSRGVSLLLDGLTLFANDARQCGSPDIEVEAALKIVRLLALRTNMRQPFTTVLLQ